MANGCFEIFSCWRSMSAFRDVLVFNLSHIRWRTGGEISRSKRPAIKNQRALRIMHNAWILANCFQRKDRRFDFNKLNWSRTPLMLRFGYVFTSSVTGFWLIARHQHAMLHYLVKLLNEPLASEESPTLHCAPRYNRWLIIRHSNEGSLDLCRK